MNGTRPMASMHRFRAKRSLGQNFLKNIGVARRMADLARIGPGDTVVEIGPGRGMLTRALLERGGRVMAVEKDDVLASGLQDAYRHDDRVIIVHQDILDVDLGAVIPPGAKIVANLPYNIATNLLIRLAGEARHIKIAVLMLQQEVAERICARAGDHGYSALSALVWAGFEARAAFVVEPDNFTPRPKVVSRVVILSPRSDAVPQEDFGLFRTVVFCAFSGRRKVLRNTLVNLAGIDRGALEDLARSSGLDLSARAQQTSCETLYRFSRAYGSCVREARPCPEGAP